VRDITCPDGEFAIGGNTTVTKALSFEVHVDQSYEQALETVAAALKAEGFGVLTKIDVQATLKDKLGEDFRPYAILGACNPPLAHQALSHEAQAGLMLPCNITVEAAPEGGSIVRIADPDVMIKASRLEGNQVLREVANEARARLERVAQSLAGS
jgi:uncharacterized protein (DUF302 family)